MKQDLYRRKLMVAGFWGLLLGPRQLFAAQIAAKPRANDGNIQFINSKNGVALLLPAAIKNFHLFHLDNPSRVIIDIPATVIAASLLTEVRATKARCPWINSVRIAHLTPQNLRIVWEVNTAVHLSNHQNNQHRLLAFAPVNQQSAAPVLAAATTKAYSPPARPVKTQHLVMIDPGHGGKDPGAIGFNGTQEKHVVLEIAKLLKRELEKNKNTKAVLTREDDRFIPLYNRVDIAHQHDADLFISIHADGFDSSEVSGASVFALSPSGATSAMARYLSQSENDADLLAGKNHRQTDNYLATTLFDLQQTETVNLSLDFGRQLIKNIKTVHPMHNNQTEQAGFVVLKSPKIPSVLVETSFITNHHEEHLLGEPAFRQKLASSLSKGIMQFLDQLKTA